MSSQKKLSNEVPEEDLLTSNGNNHEQQEVEVEADRSDSSNNKDKQEYVSVELADAFKEVQCHICLGIIRKTRVIKECIHRFCKDCIDKYMQLGKNECPACGTHIDGLTSLKDNPSYDELIAILYPNIDKYEEQEHTGDDGDKIETSEVVDASEI